MTDFNSRHPWGKDQVRDFAKTALEDFPGCAALLSDKVLEGLIARWLILGPLSCREDLTLTADQIRALYWDVVTAAGLRDWN